jgi:hypothetical protein
MQLPDNRGVMRIEAVRKASIPPVHRHGVLRQIVGPHAEERADLGETVSHQHRRRGLDHHADRDRLGGSNSGGFQ